MLGQSTSTGRDTLGRDRFGCRMTFCVYGEPERAICGCDVNRLNNDNETGDERDDSKDYRGRTGMMGIRRKRKASINCSEFFLKVRKVIGPLSVVDGEMLSVDDGLEKKGEAS